MENQRSRSLVFTNHVATRYIYEILLATAFFQSGIWPAYPLWISHWQICRFFFSSFIPLIPFILFCFIPEEFVSVIEFLHGTSHLLGIPFTLSLEPKRHVHWNVPLLSSLPSFPSWIKPVFQFRLINRVKFFIHGKCIFSTPPAEARVEYWFFLGTLEHFCEEQYSKK